MALDLARRLRAWRLSPRGAGMTQADLSARSGVGLTPIKRFEKTGGITLASLVALMRALGLLDRLEALVPDPETPGPLEILELSRARPVRQRAPRKPAHG
ncbi:MAG: helix-turn-helix transcriptional regulator [Deltaproteobacteria bacterium]|nr:helix-turn-helix transcriptional regulator [Deltaproteobacteria bacterium]